MSMHISGPLFVGGVQVGVPFQAQVRGQLPGGKAIFVSNRTGVSAGNGTEPSKPFASILTALGQVESNRGDCIYVGQGHAQNVDAADWASAMSTKAGFSIVGCGMGPQRPSLTWTTAGSTLLLDTANVELANFNLFLAGEHVTGSALTVAAPITVSGEGCRVVNNDIKWGFENDRIVGDGIIWTGDKGVFAGNKAAALVAAVPSNTFLTLTGADDFHMYGNWIEGATDATTRGVVDVETTECLRMMVEQNYISNLLASSTIAFSPLASSTGTARRNDFFVNSGILPITAALLSWHENYVVNGAGEAGALVGTASA